MNENDDIFEQFPVPSIVSSHTMLELEHTIITLRQEISALQLMEKIYTKQFEVAKKEVDELEAQWLMEMPNETNR